MGQKTGILRVAKIIKVLGIIISLPLFLFAAAIIIGGAVNGEFGTDVLFVAFAIAACGGLAYGAASALAWVLRGFGEEE